MIGGSPLTVEVIRGVLRGRPGLDARELLIRLRSLGLSVADKHELNSFLYRHLGEVAWQPGPGTKRLWFAVGTDVEAAPPDPTRLPAATDPLSLYPWQQRALGAWEASGRRGVVEAVTGAGKTRLALQAIIDALGRGERTAVIVPTLNLMRQWRREVEVHVRPRVSRPPVLHELGGGASGDLHHADILVCSASSAARWELLPKGRVGLLIADECHHYGAQTWGLGLEDAFVHRLGLTATYEREDNGIQDLLDPFFGGVCYSVGYEEALRDDVIARFRVAFIGTRFAPGERGAYDEASAKAARYRSRLINEFGLPAEPFGLYMRGVQRLRHAAVPEGSRLAGFYLSAFTRRRKLMAESRSKLDVLSGLGGAVRDAERTIVFAQTVAAAGLAIASLERHGHTGAVIEASMAAEERQESFDAFERGDLSVVAAPRLLDEGVDVPAADLAIVLATSRSRRQLIQRMGRVIRRKRDGRAARLAILYVEDTAEDPATGAHEDFLEMVTSAADDVRVFPPGSDRAGVTRYLAPP